jgi:hypothetical protein
MYQIIKNIPNTHVLKVERSFNGNRSYIQEQSLFLVCVTLKSRKAVRQKDDALLRIVFKNKKKA